jgi:hypothetical protein
MNRSEWRLDRRDFLRVSSAALAGLSLGCGRLAVRGAAPRAPFRFGLVTDSHYADADASGTRFYRESIAKMREAVERLRAERVGFLASLGDTKDMAADETDDRTLAHLTAIEAEIQRFGGPTYHVLGNHDMDNLSKSQFLSRIANTGVAPDRGYYAFSRGGLRFVVLDACYAANGRDYDHGDFDWRDTSVPPAELDWLSRELASAAEPVVVLAHQRLDGSGDLYVNNSAAVRAVLEQSGNVLAVFTGHDHPGGYNQINGIHYYTQIAMVEGSGEANNAYTVVGVDANLNMTVTGYRRGVTRAMQHAEARQGSPDIVRL